MICGNCTDAGATGEGGHNIRPYMGLWGSFYLMIDAMAIVAVIYRWEMLVFYILVLFGFRVKGW